jgi:hypothetical protein
MNLDDTIRKTYKEITEKLYLKKAISYAPVLRITTGKYYGESDLLIVNGKIEINQEIRISKLRQNSITDIEFLKETIYHELAHEFELDCSSQRHKDIIEYFRMVFEN